MNTSEAGRSYEIFASYSHRDVRFIKPMVAYLQPTGTSVFRDEDSIPPGKQWALVITNAIEGCRVLYLFWCHHSATSDEVKKEYEQALNLNKDIVPVLLDDTPLPESLSRFQWVDFRAVVGKHEDEVEQSMSLEEGQEIQRQAREERGYSPGKDGYFGGDFARQGWEQRGNQYVRKHTVEKDVSEVSIQQAAALLRANIDARQELLG